MFKNGRLVPFLRTTSPIWRLRKEVLSADIKSGGVFIYLKQVWFGGGGGVYNIGGGEGEKIEGFTIHCTSCTPPGHTRISS